MNLVFFNFASSLPRSCRVFALRFSRRASSAAGSSIYPASGEEIVRWSMLAVADGGSCVPAATICNSEILPTAFTTPALADRECWSSSWGDW
jgi:hypothetical protein